MSRKPQPPKDRRTTQVSCYSLPLGLADRMKAAAKADGRNVSNWLTKLVEDGLAAVGAPDK